MMGTHEALPPLDPFLHHGDREAGLELLVGGHLVCVVEVRIPVRTFASNEEIPEGKSVESGGADRVRIGGYDTQLDAIFADPGERADAEPAPGATSPTPGAVEGQQRGGGPCPSAGGGFIGVRQDRL